MAGPDVRTLPPLNGNYDPPRPWRCVVHEPHDCRERVIGAMGAMPVCGPGALALHAAQQADRKRVTAWAESPEGRRALAEEAAMERWIEFR